MADGQVVYEVKIQTRESTQKLDKLNTTLTKVDKNVKKIDTKKANNSLKTLGDNSKSSGNSLKRLATQLATTFGIIKLFDFGLTFEKSFAKASTLIDSTKVDMSNLEKQILSLSSSSGIAASELNEGLYQALSAGIPITGDAAETMAFMARMTLLAKGGHTDLTTAVDATTSVLNAYNLSTKEANRITDILIKTQDEGKTTVGDLGGAIARVAPIAAELGVEFEQVGSALSVITLTGASASEATTAFRQVLTELSREGTKASDTLKELTGKGFEELISEGKTVSEILDIMSKSAKDNNTSFKDLFSSQEAALGAIALTGEGAIKFSETMAVMGNGIDATKEAAETMEDTLQNELNVTLQSLKNTLIEVFLAIAPVINGILSIINSLGILQPILTAAIAGFIAYKLAVSAAWVVQNLFNKAKLKEIGLWALSKAAMLKDIAIKGITIVKTIALAIANAAAAVAGIPFVGPVLAIAAIAGITAAILAATGAIPAFAHGGIVKASSGGTVGVFGEAGSNEAVVPLTAKGISTFTEGVGGLSNMGSRKQNIIINVNNTFDEDGITTVVLKNFDENAQIFQPSLQT